MDTVTTDTPAAEIIPPAEPKPWEAITDGEYAIVELFGHTTLVGRITEVERFGSKMLAIEPIFNGRLLDPVYNGGAAIYRLTPCSRQIAWERQHKETWSLPPSIKAVVPVELLPAPEPAPTRSYADDDDEDDDGPRF
jgi:hypothetical protein